MPPRSPTRDVFGRLLALAFAAVVSSFFASTVIVEQSSSSVVGLAEDIIHNTAPSIEHLARVRKSVLEAELSLLHIVEDPVVRDATNKRLDAALRDADAGTRAYLALAPTKNEQPRMLELQQAWLHLVSTIRDTRSLAEKEGRDAAAAAFLDKVEPARARFLEAVTEVMEHNAVIGREHASEIRRIRARDGRSPRLTCARWRIAPRSSNNSQGASPTTFAVPCRRRGSARSSPDERRPTTQFASSAGGS